MTSPEDDPTSEGRDLSSLAHALLPGRQDADDVAQDAWLVLERRGTGGVRSMRAWVRLAIRHLAMRRNQRDRRRSERERIVARPERTPSTLELLEQRSQHERLVALMDELREPYREVLRLRYLEDREVEEIAQLTGRTPSTIRSQMKRGLDQLRARLNGERGWREKLLAFVPWVLRRSGNGVRPALEGATVVGVLALGACLVVGLWMLGNRDRPELEDVRTAALDQPAPAVELALAPREAIDAQPPPSMSQPAIEGGTVRLAGRVLAPDESPVAGAAVYATRGRNELRRVATSDEEGRYSAAVDAGESLFAESDRWWDSRLVYGGSVLRPDSLDLHLTDVVARGPLLVLTSEGVPVAGASIDFYVEVDSTSAVGRSARGSSTMSPQGAIEVFNNGRSFLTGADGAVSVPWPSKHAQVFAWVQGDPHSTLWTGRVSAPLEGEPRVIRLPRPGEVRGHVRTASGAPAAGATVEIVQHDARVSRSAVTDARGWFRLGDLSPGSFILRVAEDPLLGTDSARIDGELTEREQLEVTLELSSLHTLRGIVRSSPGVAAASVQLSQALLNEADVPAREVAVGPDGRFAITGCAQAPHNLKVWGMDGRLIAREIDVRPGKELVISPAVVSQERAPLVLDVDTPPSIHAPLFLELRGALTERFVLPARGTRFTSEPLPAGQYRVVAQCPMLGGCDLGRVRHDPANAGPQRLHVPLPGRLEIELVAPPGVDCDGVSIAVRTEGLSRAALGKSDGSLVRPLVHDPLRGIWEIELFPGDYWPVYEGPHVATGSELVTVSSDETRRRTLVLEAGLPVSIRVEMPRGLDYDEQLTLEVLTPRGPTRLPVSIARRYRVHELEWNLPRDATRLVLSSDRGLVGELELPLGALDGVDGVPSFVLRPEQR